MVVLAGITLLCLPVSCRNSGRSEFRNSVAAASAELGDQHGSLRVEGTKRTYLVHLPPTSVRRGRLPVVLAFHGRFGTGAAQEKLSNFNAVADREGFLVVYPDGIGRSWNAGHGVGKAERRNVDDVQFVSKLIDAVVKEYGADPARVYAAGMSMGGIFSHRLGCELADRIAAVASVAGPMSSSEAVNCQPTSPVSVMILHGVEDRIVPYEGGQTRSGGEVGSVPETLAAWARVDSCKQPPSEQQVASDIVCRTYSECRQGSEVVMCAFAGAGHTWPGGEQYAPKLMVGKTNGTANASEMIWDFFKRHQKSR